MPTRMGAVLIRRAEAVEQVLAQASAEIALQAVGLAGPLTIAGTPGALMSLLPAAIETMRQRYPRFELRIQEARDSDLNVLLRAMQVDLTLSTVGMEKPPADIEEITITQDDFKVIVAADHPLDAQIGSLAKLRELPWAARGTRRVSPAHRCAVPIYRSQPAR